MKKNKAKVAVLLSSYNGEKYICEQLDSLLEQCNIDLDILIRDDGSKDATVNIIKRYANKYKNIKLLNDERGNLGYAYSFWQLLTNSSDDYDYYAFCDQDDIWKENKLINAIKKLETYTETPTLYTSRVISINNSMQVLSEDTFKYDGVLNKYESFQKSMFPGCVFVFNNKAKTLLNRYNGFMESHDWATYAIINSFGKIIYDNNSYVNYRIHELNTIGHKSNLKMTIEKIKRFFSKSKNTRSKFAKNFYETYESEIEDKTFRESIKQLAYYRFNKKLKTKLIFNRNFKGITFKIYILLNRV